MQVIEFMDEIVEAVEEFGREAVEEIGAVLFIVAKVVVLITAPVWILPYKLIRREAGND